MWSDPSPEPRGGVGVAEDLHAALGKLGEGPPFVLVAHSIGGPYAMIYTKRYAPEVAGLVFVDASHPDQLQRLAGVLPDARSQLGVMKAMAALSWTGLLRAVVAMQQRMAARVPGMPRQPAEPFRKMAAYAPTSIDRVVEESEAMEATLVEAGTLHDEDASWSSRGRHELVSDASHYIQFDRPDVVIAAVRTVVESVRAERR